MAARKTTIIEDQPQDEAPPISEREEAVEGVFQLAQFGAITMGWFADAGAIGYHGPGIQREVMRIGAKYPKIGKKLDLLIDAGPWSALIAVALPLALQGLVNHGIFKAEQFANAGVVSPETLEYQMKATIMRQQMEALKAQREAEEELARMQEEMDQPSEKEDELAD